MSVAVAAAPTVRQLSRLELLPRELRDNIYGYRGLSTKITDAGLRLPTPLGVRNVLLVGRRGLQVHPPYCGEEGLGFVDFLGCCYTGVKALLALSITCQMFRAEIEELLFGNAVLLVTLRVKM